MGTMKAWSVDYNQEIAIYWRPTLSPELPRAPEDENTMLFVLPSLPHTQEKTQGRGMAEQKSKRMNLLD